MTAALAARTTASAQEMTFIEHLEELRRRLVWAPRVCRRHVCGLLDVFWRPLRHRKRPDSRQSGGDPVSDATPGYFRAPHEGHARRVDLLLVAADPDAGLVVISPGLYRHERRYAIPFVLSASALFIAGGVFGYYVAFPTALRFFLDWIVASKLTPIIDAVEYFDLFFSIMVALGIVFQIPAIVFVLSRIGLVTARMLVRYFKHAVLGCVVVAAVITPTTDFANMLMIAGPMIALYCVGIGVAWVFGRRRVPDPVTD